METKVTCPLGHECERIANGRLEICAWYTKVQGTDPQTQEITNESKCAIAWLPILNVQQASTGINIAASIQSLRNETVAKQAEAIKLVGEMKHEKINSD